MPSCREPYLKAGEHTKLVSRILSVRSYQAGLHPPESFISGFKRVAVGPERSVGQELTCQFR